MATILVVAAVIAVVWCVFVLANVLMVLKEVKKSRESILEHQAAIRAQIAQQHLDTEAAYSTITKAAVETVAKSRSSKPGTITAFRKGMLARAAGIDE